MSLKARKYIFAATWAFLLIVPLVTVFKTTPFSEIFQSGLILTNVFQRLFGLLAFTLLSIQIILGANMSRFVQVIGARAYKVHVTQGLIAYGFMLIHPLFENTIVYLATRNLAEALLVFIPSLESQRDIFLVFGRFALILATISVTVAYFRTKPFFRRNWRAFHVLNYLTFYLVFIHARVGTDVATFPFSFIYWLAFIVVSFTVFSRLLGYLYKFIPLKGRIVEKSSQK